MTAAELQTSLPEIFPGLNPTFAFAEHTYFYNPDGLLKRGIYFATIKERDGPKDKSSNLDRPGVFRLSFGVGKSAFTDLFGAPPARPPKGILLDLADDFSQLNVLTPHPVYAWMSWVAINQPSDEKLDELLKILDAAYVRVQENYAERIRKLSR